MFTKDEIISRNADEFLWHLLPFGSLDIMHMIRTAYEVHLTPKEVADILYEQAYSLCIDLFNQDSTTDLNALLNMYILEQAKNDIYTQLNINLDKWDVYFFANYLDDPLQYPTEAAEAIQEAINEQGATQDDFNDFSLYVFDEMGIKF